MTAFDFHSDSFVEREQMGVSRPYRSNFRLENPIDSFHQMLATCPTNGARIDIGVKGSLRRADALKLYELAWFAEGDVLEFGTNRGLSAFILATAIRNAGRPRNNLVTMEISAPLIEIARKTLASRGIGTGVEFLVGDAAESCDRLIAAGRRFGLAFVDHSHAYEPVRQACDRLLALLSPGACVVFHDFNDRRNTLNAGIGESTTEYGVYNAVMQHLPADEFGFVGVCGCCGVYRRW